MTTKDRLMVAAVAVSLSLLLGLAGCEDKGPLEQAGEEVDEAFETLKEGEESTANKVDDAMDDLRQGAEDAAEEIKQE